MRVARIERVPELPSPVHDVLRRLADAGARAWLVGGTVRDLLLGKVPRDHDVATDLVPARVAAVLPGADCRDAGFGVVRVAHDGPPISVTTLRRETGYQDRRRPDAVEFVTDVAIDASRRDFTVNALYLDVARGELLDPVDGRRDLDERRLRCIGDPMVRLREDPLRLLRAVRFAARCALDVDATTATAMRALASEARTVSAERVFDELTAAFTGEGRGRSLRLLVDLGLAAVLLPEVAAMDGVTQPPEYHPEGDVLTHVALVLDHVPAGDPVLAWSAVLHDAGKPPTWRQAEDRIRFDGHDTLSARMADAVLRRFHASNALREQVVDVCLHHIRFASLPQMRPRRRERWMRTPGFANHLAFHRADCLGSHGKLAVYEMVAAWVRDLPPVAEPLVTGSDVLELGVPPGPHVGKLLIAVHEAADESPTPVDRSRALTLLREMVDQWRQGGPGANR